MKVTALYQGGIVVSLLCIGFNSMTMTRHLIQAIPLVVLLIAGAAGRRKDTWLSFAAFPVFIFWFLIMLFVWLYLTGIARITKGHFSTGEIIFSVLIGLCSLAGFVFLLKHFPIKNILLKILFTTASVLLTMVGMYVLKLGSSHHYFRDLLIAASLTLLLLLCIVTPLRNSSSPNPITSLLAILVFSLFQAVVMWISFQPSFQ